MKKREGAEEDKTKNEKRRENRLKAMSGARQREKLPHGGEKKGNQ